MYPANVNRPRPADILILGSIDPEIRKLLFLWQTGDLSWDQALAAMVLDLYSRLKAAEVNVIVIPKPGDN